MIYHEEREIAPPPDGPLVEAAGVACISLLVLLLIRVIIRQVSP